MYSRFFIGPSGLAQEDFLIRLGPNQACIRKKVLIMVQIKIFLCSVSHKNKIDPGALMLVFQEKRMLGRTVLQRISLVLGVLCLGLLGATYNHLNAEVITKQESLIINCMTECIRTEGKSQKEKCKWRCANVSNPSNKIQDCMAIYKGCFNTCGPNKSCRVVCKKQLMNCK